MTAISIGEQRRLGEVVGDEHRGRVRRREGRRQLAGRRGGRARVERGERLVEEDQLRLARERPRQRDALALAAGEPARRGVGELRGAEAPE